VTLVCDNLLDLVVSTHMDLKKTLSSNQKDQCVLIIITPK